MAPGRRRDSDGRGMRRERRNDRETDFKNEEKVPRNDRLPPYGRGDIGVAAVPNEDEIMELLGQRELARRRGKYSEADDLRDELLFRLGVHVDDKSEDVLL